MESKNLRTDLTTALDEMRRSFDALTLAQDDRLDAGRRSVDFLAVKEYTYSYREGTLVRAKEGANSIANCVLCCAAA